MEDEGSWTRRLVDAISGPMSYVDRDERYVFVNRGYEDWFMETSDHIVGRTVQCVLGDAAYAVVRPRVRSALSGRLVEFETDVPYRTAGRRRVLARYVPDVDERGKVHGFYCVVQEREAQQRSHDRLQEASRRQIQVDQQERRDLAEELQADLGQRLSLLAMELHRAADECAPARQLRELQQMAGDACKRLASFGLRISPTVLYDVGPVAAADWLAQRMSQTGLLKVHVDEAPEIPHMPEAARAVLYVALQELLHNVASHAGTHEAWVRFERAADRVRLRVADAGVGCDPSDGVGGCGLLRVRQAVRELGGSFEIVSRPGRETLVTVELPLEAEAARS